MTPSPMMQLRPQGQERFYSPNRDLAYVYPVLLKEAFIGLDAKNWQSWFGKWLEDMDVTEGDLGEGVQRFLEGHSKFIGDPTIANAKEALDAARFYALPYPVIITLFARIGQVLTGGFFYALRTVTKQGEMPPQAAEIADFVAAGRILANKLAAYPPLPPEQQKWEDVEAERQQQIALLELERERLRSRILKADSDNQLLREELAVAKEQNSQLESKWAATEQMLSKVSSEFRKANEWLSLPWYRRIFATAPQILIPSKS